MLECVGQALLFAVVGGSILGLIVGLFAPLVTRGIGLIFFVALIQCC
jgi:hypothetical protein